MGGIRDDVKSSSDLIGETSFLMLTTPKFSLAAPRAAPPYFLSEIQ